jgi:hypothetical protein
MLSRLHSWVRGLTGRSTMESEMDVELRFHIEARAEDLIREHGGTGLTRDEALRQARLEFGAVDKAKEECRESRGVGTLEAQIRPSSASSMEFCCAHSRFHSRRGSSM